MGTVKRLVVAGTSQEWKDHCRDHGYDPLDTPLIRFSDQIRGFRDLDVHYVGQYFKLDDLGEIADYCQSHNMTVPGETK